MSAALLALAVTLAWPSAGPLSLASHTHMHGVEAAMTPQHSAHCAHAHGHMADVHVDCQPSGTGCCTMTLCHPGVTITTHGMAFKRKTDETEAARATEALGRDLDVDVPPPRILLG